MPSKDDPITLVVDSTEITGWEDVSVTLRCEGLPNSFQLTVAPIDPLTGVLPLVQADDPVKVYLGADLVITGYVDSDHTEASPESHALTLAGRGRTRDLVRCSAQWKGGLISGQNILGICNTLGAPYGIGAHLGYGLSAPAVIPSLALNYGETCASIIERVARNQRVLFYERPDGDLLLAQVGAIQAASGAIYGENVQEWSCTNDNADRFATIYCAQFSTDPIFDQQYDFNLFGEQDDKNVRWPSVLIISTEGLSKDVADAKAQWEVARRAGRATVVKATVDSWRDEAGVLWTPNTLVPCSGPGLRWAPQSAAVGAGVNLVLSEVTFRYSLNGGTTAELTLMPPSAFSPEPIQLQPVAQDITAIGAAPVPTTF